MMKSALATLALVALVGCVNERLYVDENSNTSFVGGGAAPSNLQIENATLRGDFGPRTGFDGAATEITGTSDPDFQSTTASVTRTETNRGTGMLILWTNGVLLEDIQPGTYTMDPNSYETPAISANSCSGAGDSASIDYDEPTDEVEVQVTRTPEGRVFDIETRNYPMDASGEIDRSVEPVTASTTFTLVGT